MSTTSGFAPIRDANLYYEIRGEGQPLLLIHSMLFHSALWDDMIDELAEHYKVIRYDQRGYGKTETQDVYGDDVEDAVALLDHLGIEKTYVVGLSMGSSIGFMLLFDHHERVKALVMGASGIINEESTPEFDARWNEFKAAAGAGKREKAVDIFAELWVDGPVRPASEETSRRAKEIMGQYDFAFYIRSAQDKAAKAAAEQQPQEAAAEEAPAEEAAAEEEGGEWGGPKFLARMAEINVPILLVAGDSDQAGVVKAVKEDSAVVPNAEYAIVEGAAHIIPLEKPQEFTALILDFLQRQETR